LYLRAYARRIKRLLDFPTGDLLASALAAQKGFWRIACLLLAVVLLTGTGLGGRFVWSKGFRAVSDDVRARFMAFVGQPADTATDPTPLVAAAEPSAIQPAAIQPAAAQPAAPQPTAPQPAATQPSAAQPAATQPAVAATQPTVPQPAVAATQPAAPPRAVAATQPAAPPRAFAATQPAAPRPAVAARQPAAPRRSVAATQPTAPQRSVATTPAESTPPTPPVQSGQASVETGESPATGK
jgi:hypothetical protein